MFKSAEVLPARMYCSEIAARDTAPAQEAPALKRVSWSFVGRCRTHWRSLGLSTM